MGTGQVLASRRRGRSLSPAGIRHISPAARSLYRIHRPGSWHRSCKCRNIVVLLREEGSFWGRVHGSDPISREMYDMAR